MERTRRNVLETVAGALSAVVLAGCSGSGDDSSDDGNGDSDDDSEPEEEPADEPEEWTLELLAEEHVDHEHACLHPANDDRISLEAGASIEAAPRVEATHDLWEVTVAGDEGYVVFAAENHDYHGEGPFAFYAADGAIEPAEGTEIGRNTVAEAACEEFDEYVEINPEDGRIALGLTQP